MEAQLHVDEPARLAALRRYNILDTPREREFDDIVRVVSAICDTPISVINLIDEGRQWFKAEVGLGVRETPLPASICAHAILQRDLLVVPDTTDDRRFADNPLVTGDPHLRFYAGALLETSEGLPLGTICVLDYRPRTLDDNQKALLKLMASQIMKLLEARRMVDAERLARGRAEELLIENETLARESDHRVMNSLNLVSAFLSLKGRNASAEVKAELDDARHRVLAIATVHRQLHLTGSLEDIEIGDFLKRLCDALMENAPAQLSAISVQAEPALLSSQIVSELGLIVAELVANCFKHAFADGRKGSIKIVFSLVGTDWVLSSTDNGIGLPPDFAPARSKGTGMRVVTALASRLGATLTASSDPSGTTFVVAHS